MMNIEEIKKVLPHRYPFLMVDRIEELEEGKKVVGIKNVTINEEFFQGHYPEYPVMPGVLIVESMAQVGGLIMLANIENPEEKLPFFAGIDKARFRKPVVPGDQLKVICEVIRQRGKVAKVKANAFVDDEKAAEAELMFVIQDR